ncbi:MAG: hypothetical protein GX595_14365 [Lentisphaerae bacterium]|nr:hypothetical protein [Lentisphaerota bacterium]
MAGLTCLAVGAAPAAPVARMVIPADAFRPEIGFCYVVGLDLGEEGDKETGNRSQLVLLEDGEPLGPPRALHADIRNLGQGRYSHWTRSGLFMSARDNSDPRQNGRRYEVISTNPESSLSGPLSATGPVREHQEVITAGRHEYSVRMGGLVDFENGRSRFNSGMRVAFQPNLSLTLANTGDTPVRWPKVLINDRGDWGTLESMIAEFTRGAETQMERALFVWENTRHARYHCLPLFPDDEFHDPVKLLNCYGLNLCDDLGYAGSVLFGAAGLGRPTNPEDPFVRALNGHVQVETMVDGRFAFLDIDEEVFHLDRENRHLISGDECMVDHDLARREVHYGPEFGGWSGSETNAALFGADDTKLRHTVSGHTLDHTLRPGEAVELRWDNIGKFACHSEKWRAAPPYYGNSKLHYVPRLSAAHWREGIAAEQDIAAVDPDALAGTTPTAQVAYAVSSPWVIVGGTLRPVFDLADAADAASLSLVLPGGAPQRVWEGRGPGRLQPEVALDEALLPHQAPGKYAYQVVVGLHSAPGTTGARLAALRMETDVMAAPLSLPRLRLGENRVVYSDRTEGPRQITVTHRWQECDQAAAAPPAAPTVPLSPLPGTTTRETFPTLSWEPVPRATAYHLRVSLRPDMALPYRPNYDLVIRSSTWSIPFRGMFSPGVQYHWRVRARSARGVWSEWSPVWTFRWDGPMVPRDVRVEPQGEGFVLRWNANPSGTRPVAYKVYGSDERGFPEHDEPYTGFKRGALPANLLGRTESTEMLVVTTTPTHDNQNRCFYRVVAVDAEGTESASSAFAELPHPHVWSRPTTTARVGEAFRYAPGVLTSLNDVQYRYEQPITKLWDAEVNRFELTEAPAWLTIDAATGVMGGVPTAAGEAAVAMVVSNQHGGRAEQRFTLRIAP